MKRNGIKVTVNKINASGRPILSSMIPATESCRKTPEIAGTWKQYSDRKWSGFFPVGSCQLPVLSRPEIIEKIRKFPVRNTASRKSPELPGTGSFRTGLFNLGISWFPKPY